MRFAPLPVTLRQLQYVVAVAEEASFRGAAARCAVSQPSLSAQIAEAEGALGVRLFERDRRGVLLTAAGQELVARARRILIETGDLAEAARRFVDPLAGTLRIGVIPTLAPYLLPLAAPALRRAFPRLTVIWIEEKTPTLVEGLAKGSLDGALLALEADLGDLDYEAVGADPFVLATAPGHPLAKGRGRLRTESLAGERILLLDDGHCLREQALAICSRATVDESDVRATSLATLVQMVGAGLGVTLLPAIAVEAEAKHGGLCVRPFAPPVPHRTLAMAWRRRSPLGAALRSLAGEIRGVLPAGPRRPPAG
ncbi:LysR substrate-binding domain-containing protein [Vulgatibacter sp.]|uniref:LysR substrate-binding domain-containing protein n=1 Tax=Vulgatibacter sp. TaxID=1971226 RepID=UPI003566536F